MNILSFIASVILAAAIIEGLLILLKDCRSAERQLFFLICLSISIWLLGGAFGYSSANREEAFFWLKVTSPGFIFMHAFVLHFVLHYTGNTGNRLIFIIYLPSFIFLYVSLTETLVFSDIYREGKYWVMVPDYSSAVFYLLMANYLSYYIISLILLFKKIRVSKSIRIRRQGRIIFTAIVITIACYNIEPFLAPLFFDYHTYGQAPFYSIVWLTFLWYAMSRYQLLGIYDHLQQCNFIDSFNEFIIVTDQEKRIIKINKALADRISRSEKPYSLNEIFVEHELIERLIDSPGDDNPSGLTLNMIIPGNNMETVSASISVFKDRFGDTIGFIISAREASDAYSVFNKNGITGREMQIIKLIISGNSNREIAGKLGIAVRTVETHITNIYGKLGLKNRNELINYCSGIVTQQPGI